MIKQPPRKRAREEEANQTVKFDGSDPDLHDVVIVVEQQKFYCSKMDLARHSPTFHRMFFTNFQEKDRAEVTLEKIEAEAFQLFLELINGAGTITDENVHGQLALVDYLNAAVPKNKCIEFLIRDSKKAMHEMLEIANEYDLEEVLVQICSKIRTTYDLNTALPTDRSTLKIMAQGMLFEKSLKLLNAPKPPQQYSSNNLQNDHIHNLIMAARNCVQVTASRRFDTLGRLQIRPTAVEDEDEEEEEDELGDEEAHQGSGEDENEDEEEEEEDEED